MFFKQKKQKVLPEYIQELEKSFRDPDQWVCPESFATRKEIRHKYINNSVWIGSDYPHFTWVNWYNSDLMPPIHTSYRKYLYSIFIDTMDKAITLHNENHLREINQKGIDTLRKVNNGTYVSSTDSTDS